MTNVLCRGPGGGGGGAIRILDEGVLVANDVNCINFRGVDIQAVVAASGCDVDIWVPPTPLAPFLDTVGLTFPPGTWGYISDPQGTFTVGPYAIGSYVEGYLAPTNTNINTPVRIRDFNNGAQVSAYINGVSQEMLTISNEGNPEFSPNGWVSVNNFNLNGLGEWEAILSATVQWTTWMPGGGGALIEYRHSTNVAGVKIWNTNRFYDIGGSPPTMSNPGIDPNTPLYKYLSGVPFYMNGSTFDIWIMNGANFWNQLYSLNPLRIDYTEFAAGTTDYNKNSLNPGHLPNPHWDDPAYYSGNTFTLGAAPNICSEDATIGARCQDPFNSGGWQYIPALPEYMVNNYASPSTDIREYFRDEVYRLPSGAYDIAPSPFTNQWNSVNNLLTYDDNQGLQVGCAGLTYPTKNYSANKLPSGGPNYTGASGYRYYYRVLRDNGNTHANCTLRLTGLSYANIQDGGGSQIAKVEIKLPTETAWGNVGKYYAAAEDPTIDGWGALDSYAGSDFDITFHGKFTANSSFMIIIKVTYFTNVPLCTYIGITDW